MRKVDLKEANTDVETFTDTESAKQLKVLMLPRIAAMSRLT